MQPFVLYRESIGDEAEKAVCSKYFDVINRRSQAWAGSLVIGRYSVLPYYKELCDDLEFVGSKLINSHRQHRYIADLANWYEDLSSVTPRTWFNIIDLPKKVGPVVVKGETNSKKHLWQTHMFANNWTEASVIESKLNRDGLLANQHIYFRKYVPLKTFFKGIQGLPCTEEYRFFFYKEHLLCGGFYWSEHYDQLTGLGYDLNPDQVPKDFLDMVAKKVSPHVNFYVVDVARTADGNWIVVELNDGQMSGLSMCDPEELYFNLRGHLNGENT